MTRPRSATPTPPGKSSHRGRTTHHLSSLNSAQLNACPVAASTWPGTGSCRSPTVGVPVGSNIRIAAPAAENGLCSIPRAVGDRFLGHAPPQRCVEERPGGVVDDRAVRPRTQVLVVFVDVGPLAEQLGHVTLDAIRRRIPRFVCRCVQSVERLRCVLIVGGARTFPDCDVVGHAA